MGGASAEDVELAEKAGHLHGSPAQEEGHMLDSSVVTVSRKQAGPAEGRLRM